MSGSSDSGSRQRKIPLDLDNTAAGENREIKVSVSEAEEEPEVSGAEEEPDIGETDEEPDKHDSKIKK